MRAPRYFRRRFAPVLWGVFAALCLAGALVLAGMLTIRQVERQTAERVTREIRSASDTLLAQAIARGRELDAIAQAAMRRAAQRDTVWLRVRETARQEASAPVPASTDTAALVAAVRSCRATLDATVSACDSVQAAQREVIAAQQAKADADAKAREAQALQTASIQRSRDEALARLARTTQGRTRERAACAASVGLNLIQWRLAK